MLRSAAGTCCSVSRPASGGGYAGALPIAAGKLVAPAQILLSRHGWLSRQTLHLAVQKYEERGGERCDMSNKADIRTATQAHPPPHKQYQHCVALIERCVARAHTHTQQGRCTHPRHFRPVRPTLQAPHIHTPRGGTGANNTQPKGCNLCSPSGEAHVSTLLACCGKAHISYAPGTPLQPVSTQLHAPV